MVLFALVGCAGLDGLLSGITDPDIAEALVLGFDKPADLDLEDTRFAGSGRAALFLLNVEHGPVRDAEVALRGDGEAALPLVAEGDGAWATSETGGLAYSPGTIYAFDRDGEEILRAEAAPRVAAPPPATLPAGQPLSIDASGQDFDTLFAVVLDPLTGTELWSNAPTDEEAIGALLLEEPVLAVEIPADTFAAPGPYVVGLAGLRGNAVTDVSGVNTLASIMVTGVVTFTAVNVAP